MADATLFSTAPRAGAGVAPEQGSDGAPAGRYTDMRESGVPWLGRVPAHWTMRRLKTNLSRNDGGVWGADFDPDGTIVLRSTEQTVGGDWKIDDPARRALSASERAGALLVEGDLVITKSSGSEFHIGKTSIVTAEVAALDCCFSNFMQRLRCDRRTAPRFAYYILNSPIGREQMVYGSNTSTGLANLNGGVIGNIVAAWPPLPEQEAIAAWLDERTRRIDELVAAKRRLIDLLAEQRTALITHAVTKGLNAHAPMKPSGIDWLGDVPRHWEVAPLRRKWRVIDCKHRTVPFLDEGIPLASIGQVQRIDIDLSTAKKTSEEEYALLIDGERRPRRGDIIYSRNATVGEAAFVNTDEIFCMGQDVCMIRSRDQDQRYLVHQLRSPVVMSQLDQMMVGATFKRINIADVKGLIVACPPPAQQRDIAAYIDQTFYGTGGINGVIAAAEAAIARLTEYRQVLISAAVTGKINVCGMIIAAPVADAGVAMVHEAPVVAGRIGGERRGANKHFQRTVLAAQVIATIGNKPTFGRIKLQKAMVLAEYHLRLDEIQSEPVRAAAGPFDNPMMRSVDSQLKRSQWYDYNQSQRGGKYVALAKAGGHTQYFDRYWSDRRSGFDALMKTLEPMTTEQAEIVATLYAAWNDFLIDGTAVTDDALVAEVMNNWHPDKDKITEQQWRAAIPWMRQHGLVPTGYGAHTRVASHDGSKE